MTTNKSSNVAIALGIAGFTGIFVGSGGPELWMHVYRTTISPEYRQEIMVPFHETKKRINDIRHQTEYPISGKVVKVDTYSFPFQKRNLITNEITAENMDYQIATVETDSGTKKMLKIPMSVSSAPEGESIAPKYTQLRIFH